MKVVYNACYGGFGLSDEAIKRYWKIKGGTPTERWYHRDLERDDPVLVQVVEELGKDAGHRHANLQIAEVAKGERWRIDEYDGYEDVRTVDSYDWKVAT